MSDLDIAAIAARVGDNITACFLCKWIAEDIRENGAITDYPMYGEGNSGLFKKSSKITHLELEGILERS